MPAPKRPGFPSLLIVASVGVGLYLLICLVFYLRQNALIFYPSPPPQWTPAAEGRAYRELTIATSDGERLQAWLIEPSRRGDAGGPQAAKPAVVLYSHGNAGNIAHRIDIAAVFADLGLAVLLYDYRGYGGSTGAPSEDGLYADAAAVWEHLTRAEGFAPERIVLFGESLGGAVSIELATHKRVAALILEDTFTSIADIGAHLYRWLPIRLLARTRFDSSSRIARVAAPVLVIHSPDDELVPIAHGRALFDAAREPKEFLATGGSHNAGGFRLRAEWIAAVRDFLARTL